MPPERHHLLSPLQEELLRIFMGAEDRFVLTGGTALAEYHLGHRQSEDLDLLTDDPRLVVDAAEAFERLVRKSIERAELAVVLQHRDHRRVRISRGAESTLVDIAHRQAIPTEPPLVIDGVRVAGLLDLAIGKLWAVTERVEGKDAADLWAIVQLGGIDLARVEALLRERNPYLLLDPSTVARALDDLYTALAAGLELPAMAVSREVITELIRAERDRRLRQLREDLRLRETIEPPSPGAPAPPAGRGWRRTSPGAPRDRG